MPKDERAREGYLSEMPVHETSCSLVPACNPARLQPPRACDTAPRAPRARSQQRGAPRTCTLMWPTWPPAPPSGRPTSPCPRAHAPRPPVLSQRLKEYFVAQLRPRGVALCLVLADIYKVP